MALWDKLITLARLSMLPKSSPARVLFQAALARGEACAQRELIARGDSSVFALAAATLLCILLASLCAAGPARLLGWAADFGCLGLLWAPDPSACSRAYAVVDIQSMEPAQWDKAIAASAKRSTPMAPGERALLSRLAAEAKRRGSLFAGPAAQMRALALAQEQIARQHPGGKDISQSLVLATVADAARRDALRALGDPAGMARGEGAFWAAIGSQIRAEDAMEGTWRIVAIAALCSLAAAAMAAISLSTLLSIPSKREALLAAFEYFELSKASHPLAGAKGSSFRRGRRL